MSNFQLTFGLICGMALIILLVAGDLWMYEQAPRFTAVALPLCGTIAVCALIVALIG